MNILLSLGGVRRKMKRYGTTFDERSRRLLRSSLTSLAQSVNDQVERRAKRKYLKPFFMEVQYREEIRLKFLTFHQRIE